MKHSELDVNLEHVWGFNSENVKKKFFFFEKISEEKKKKRRT